MCRYLVTAVQKYNFLLIYNAFMSAYCKIIVLFGLKSLRERDIMIKKGSVTICVGNKTFNLVNCN